MRIELAEVPLSGASEFDPAGQNSVPQFPHEVASVYFLLGQPLKEAEVFYRNDRGQVFSTEGDDGTLIAVRGTVLNRIPITEEKLLSLKIESNIDLRCLTVG